ncbi:hypothetical protein STEG23_006297, partial [Scotinomys teguina]
TLNTMEVIHREMSIQAEGHEEELEEVCEESPGYLQPKQRLLASVFELLSREGSWEPELSRQSSTG